MFVNLDRLCSEWVIVMVLALKTRVFLIHFLWVVPRLFMDDWSLWICSNGWDRRQFCIFLDTLENDSLVLESLHVLKRVHWIASHMLLLGHFQRIQFLLQSVLLLLVAALSHHFLICLLDFSQLLLRLLLLVSKFVLGLGRLLLCLLLIGAVLGVLLDRVLQSLEGLVVIIQDWLKFFFLHSAYVVVRCIWRCCNLVLRLANVCQLQSLLVKGRSRLLIPTRMHQQIKWELWRLLVLVGTRGHRIIINCRCWGKRHFSATLLPLQLCLQISLSERWLLFLDRESWSLSAIQKLNFFKDLHGLVASSRCDFWQFSILQLLIINFLGQHGHRILFGRSVRVRRRFTLLRGC